MTWLIEQNSLSWDDSIYVEYKITSYATGLEVPRGIALKDNNMMYITQRPGTITKIIDNESQKYFTVPRVWALEEAWLMGIALDPKYPDNHFIYLSVARDNHLQIIRYTDNGEDLESEKIIFDMLPLEKYHAWWALAFGPDDKLYFSVGDALERVKAQELTSYHGKILRINPDGSIPDDNPFLGSAIWSYGHRNVQGMDRTSDGVMVASEHGPSWFDGAGWGDEINIIQKGENYGWPIVSHGKHQDGMIDPLKLYTPALAPSWLIVYKGNLFPQWKWKILVAWLKWTRVVVIDPSSWEEVEILMNKDFGRLRSLAQNKLWEIFVSTSNRDSRGTAQTWDDHLYILQTK